ncbi:Metallophosphoesterase [Shigella flexneri]|nr:Metallophosphoesterase [Shigella flexneri]
MKQPAPVYQRIAGHQWRHIWLSGDIHGCLEQLRRKLEVHSRTGKHVIAHADYPDDVYEWQKDVDLHQVLLRCTGNSGHYHLFFF